MADLLEQARRLADEFAQYTRPDMRHAANTLRALVARVEAAERDAERLNSGCIALDYSDHFAEPKQIVARNIDLRAAIDAAKERK